MEKAVTDTFPLLYNDRGLIVEDFIRFSQSFAEILKKLIPTAQKIWFANVTGPLGEDGAADKLPFALNDMCETFHTGKQTFCIQAQRLMLPFILKDAMPIIAVIEGADPLFLHKVGEDWLNETRAAAEREYILLKEARVDGQTGLLNFWNLSSLLDSLRGRDLRLVLIELPAKRMSFRLAVRYSQKCAALLRNFIKRDAVLHFIGQSTFALVLPTGKEESISAVESVLVSYLKREGCHKVHLGSTSSRDCDRNIQTENSAGKLIDEAWTALRYAEKRGPFSFCDYQLLAYPENHPFAFPGGKNLLLRLARLWRHSPNFSLVLFKSFNEDKRIVELVQPLIDEGVAFAAGKDILVYLPGLDVQAAYLWSLEIIHRAGAFPLHTQISAGIAGYPHSDFKKTEVLFNCRKAALHASFFDEATAVVFDAVSLNISGDLYYTDGDLAKAVLEYKRGLKIDKDNVNLHNSLGVTLAMMGKHIPAMLSFDNALAIDKDNFMALYNLGLAEQARGRNTEAYHLLERAMLSHHEAVGGEDEAGSTEDLNLQLGILAGDIGNHQTALNYLELWQNKQEKTSRAGRALYPIGRACHGTGDNRRAMVELQRALQFNEFDDRAMDLLGTIYFREGEGAEIALALCSKSVELEPGNIMYRAHLAEIQLQCGQVSEARKNLYRCLKNKLTRGKAQVLLARSYLRQGIKKQARAWFAKALQDQALSPELREEAGLGIARIDQL